jgi:ATP-dependent helicase HepA
MLQWYHQGLGAFEHTCPAGYSVYVQVQQSLLEALHQVDEGLADLSALIAVTQKLHQELNEALHRGRDRLLEYNSCRPHVAEALRDAALALYTDDTLPDYLEALFDSHGIDSELHSENCLIVRPTDEQHGHLPGLNEEGMTITYDRATALANEDIHFLTWEHPLVRGAMEMVLDNERGNCALVATRLPGVQAGQLLLECLFVLESAGSENLTSHYLPPITLRLIIDSQGKERTNEPAFARITPAGEPIDAETATRIVRAYTDELRDMVKAGEQHASKQAPALLQQAHAQTVNTLQKEVDRLIALRRVNPNVREEEIAFFETQQKALIKAIDNAVPRLDALRVIVTT